MKSEKLNPCPFCEGRANQSYHGVRHITGCAQCGVVTQSCETRQEADKAWNARSPLTPDQVSQWLQDNGYEDMSKGIDCDFEL